MEILEHSSTKHYKKIHKKTKSYAQATVINQNENDLQDLDMAMRTKFVNILILKPKTIRKSLNAGQNHLQLVILGMKDTPRHYLLEQRNEGNSKKRSDKSS